MILRIRDNHSGGGPSFPGGIQEIYIECLDEDDGAERFSDIYSLNLYDEGCECCGPSFSCICYNENEEQAGWGGCNDQWSIFDWIEGEAAFNPKSVAWHPIEWELAR